VTPSVTISVGLLAGHRTVHGHQRRHAPATGEQRPGEGVVVHQVDLDPVQRVGDPRRVHQLGARLADPVRRRVLVRQREVRCGAVHAGAEQVDLVPSRDQPVGQVGADRLDPAVALRGHLQPRRHDDRDPQ